MKRSAKRVGTAAAALAMWLVAASPASAGVIIDGTTPGFYNAGLGDLAGDSVLGAQTDIATGFNLFPAANSAAGDPLIPPVATEPNLAGADASTVTNLGGFLSSPGSLGGTWSATQQAIPANWTVNSETAIVYQIDAGAGGLANFTVNVGVDNGIFLWLDGAYLLGALAPGGASAFEYSASVGSLSPGLHYLQVLREDHGGGTGYVIQAEADVVAAPAPASLALLVFGLAGLGAAGWRHRRREAGARGTLPPA